MKIYIIRHGETDSNKEGRIQGWYDDILNEYGIKLAEISGQNMQGIHFDEAYSSPLIRSKQTTEIILDKSGNPDTPVFFDDRLKEINMGEWEYKKFLPPDREIPEELVKQFFSCPQMEERFPGGESLNEVKVRTQSFLKELIARNDDKTYLISTHGCAMRAMLNYLYEDPQNYWQGHIPYNCTVNIIEAKDKRAEIIEKDRLFYGDEYKVDRFR